MPLKDPTLLAELSERLYERNFDPTTSDGRDDMTRVIGKVQEKIAMAPSGEPTEGLLLRMRKMDDLKPWGTIVYGPDGGKWGYAWNHASRRAAVADARGNCGGAKCPVELSFYGNSCGAFAVSPKSWSLIQRDTVQKAKDAALADCGKAGKACRVVAAVCADGTGR